MPTATPSAMPASVADTAPSTAAFLSQLADRVGAAHVLQGTDAAPYYTDWRKRYHTPALAVVRPASTEAVAAVVRLCAQHGIAIVPQGGNTGLVGGASAYAPAATRSVVLNLQRMRSIVSLDVINHSITVQAGCVLQQVQQAADEAGLLFPLSLASEGSCTIGGNLATNAGGTQVLRYGNTRELCLGLEAVTATGEIYSSLSGLRKNNTGYDLRDLFIGSEGTLGIITAATLRLFARPSGRIVAWVGVPSVDAALQLLVLARQHLQDALTGFELMNQFALSLVQRHFPHYRLPGTGSHAYSVLLECVQYAPPIPQESTYIHRIEEDTVPRQVEALLMAAIAHGLIAEDATISHSADDVQRLWQLRESIPLAQAQEGLNIKHDISLPLSALATFVQQAQVALEAAVPGVRIVNFGHVGDGNLHYNVQAPVGVDATDFLRTHEAHINTLVFDLVHSLGGSISAEHGIGQLKCDTLAHYQPAVTQQLMRAIKQALDPHGIMNPGKLLRPVPIISPL